MSESTFRLFIATQLIEIATAVLNFNPDDQKDPPAGLTSRSVICPSGEDKQSRQPATVGSEQDPFSLQ